MPTPADIFRNALLDIGIGTSFQAQAPEDIELARVKFNRMLGQWNLRQRMAYFIRTQAFTFSTSAQSYTLGTAANGATFQILAGTQRPIKILRAKLVLVASTPDEEIELPVINLDQYANIPAPALSSTVPTRLYYQPTFPNGTLWPVPYPTTTTNQLRLFFYNQLLEVAVADITTNVDMPPGLEDALTLSLSEALCLPFRKKVSADLRLQASKARALYGSINVTPPLVGTDYPASRVRPLINPRTGNYQW